jgi:hypothetical protein
MGFVGFRARVVRSHGSVRVCLKLKDIGGKQGLELTGSGLVGSRLAGSQVIRIRSWQGNGWTGSGVSRVSGQQGLGSAWSGDLQGMDLTRP